jgi:hypothetical protein
MGIPSSPSYPSGPCESLAIFPSGYTIWVLYNWYHFQSFDGGPSRQGELPQANLVAGVDVTAVPTT